MFDEQGFLVVSGLLQDEMDGLVDAAEAFVGVSKKEDMAAALNAAMAG